MGNLYLNRGSTGALVERHPSDEPNTTKVAAITRVQAEEIAKTKMADLNAADIDAAIEMIKGTARSMGVTVEE